MGTYTGQGTVRQQGLTAYQYGTFVLVDKDGETICAMRDGTARLGPYVGRFAYIKGCAIAGYPVSGGPDYVSVNFVGDDPHMRDLSPDCGAGSDEWHGAFHADLDGTVVPAMPGLLPMGALAADRADPVFARVHFSGNYGWLCGEFQEFDRYNIDKSEARQVAWSAFGTCGHTIRYYDASGQKMGEE